jgi:two-component system, NtrC family, sensor histidine kinase PilS
MHDPSRRRKLRWLLAARVLMSTLLLGSALLLQLRSPGTPSADPFFLLIGLTYALTFVWAVTVRQAEHRRWLVDAQLAGDALVFTAFIYLTGGIASYFSSLYVLPIIAAATLQRRRGATMVAALAAGMYGGLVLAQYLHAHGVISSNWFAGSTWVLPPARVAFYTVAINSCGFLLVAWLAGSLAESLRRADVRLEKATDEIANLQAFSQDVIDSLTSGLLTADYRGRILTINRAAEAILGLDAEEAEGREVAGLLQLPEGFAASLETGLEIGASRRADFRHRRAGGPEIEIGLSVAHLVTPGGRAGFLFTFQDVTESKKAERDARLQQRLAAVGEMAAGIAHEIRNPLASMSGSIQILRHELHLTEEQAQLMDIVLRESDRLNATINNFLAYARPQRFAVARLDLRRILNDAAQLLRNSAEVRDEHTIAVDVPPHEVPYEADEGQVRQIVWNLATNALKAMPDGGRLTLRAAVAGDGSGPVLAFEDTGAGIAPEALDGLFQPFRGAFAKGSGLGLAIVHRIVSDYGGEIEVTSTPGAGTLVSVRLPAVPAAAV